MESLHPTLAQTDIYLIDQLLKGRIEKGARIVDLGAGSGRNLGWFLQTPRQYDVTAVEPSDEARAHFRQRMTALGVDFDPARLIPATIEACTLPSGAFDLVICNAVLHFARDDDHFEQMVRAAFRLVVPGGLLFARLATSIGIEGRIEPLGRGRFRLPDGSDRYLTDEATLLELTADLGAEQLEPLKTTIVQGLRSMTTWVLRAR